MTALYRKYRPQDFDEVVGQEAVVRTLQNALEHDQVRQAYLFAGPRGTGKTSMARILAKALNCAGTPGPSPTPDKTCPVCLAIAAHVWQVLSGVGDGPGVPAQLSAFARMRAIDVFPVPRGPAKRYAWRTWSCSIAFVSVRTTASCPTTSSKPCGRYFR